jgi:hypothetical protein
MTASAIPVLISDLGPNFRDFDFVTLRNMLRNYVILIIFLTGVISITCFKSTGILKFHNYIHLHANDDGDDDDNIMFTRIATNYLANKFRDCRGDNCRTFVDKDEAKLLLKTILPPVTKKELDLEVMEVFQSINIDSSGDIDIDQFIIAAIKNSYWEKAGALVVKELIFLDCLANYYIDKRSMLDDEDYNDLKDALSWVRIL